MSGETFQQVTLQIDEVHRVTDFLEVELPLLPDLTPQRWPLMVEGRMDNVALALADRCHAFGEALRAAEQTVGVVHGVDAPETHPEPFDWLAYFRGNACYLMTALPLLEVATRGRWGRWTSGRTWRSFRAAQRQAHSFVRSLDNAEAIRAGRFFTDPPGRA
jgi:hypothetical protein